MIIQLGIADTITYVLLDGEIIAEFTKGNYTDVELYRFMLKQIATWFDKGVALTIENPIKIHSNH